MYVCMVVVGLYVVGMHDVRRGGLRSCLDRCGDNVHFFTRSVIALLGDRSCCDWSCRNENFVLTTVWSDSVIFRLNTASWWVVQMCWNTRSYANPWCS